MNPQKQNDIPFLASLKNIGQQEKNYLGDHDTVEAMLRFYIATLIENLDDAQTDRQKIKEIRSIAREVGNILLGLESRKFIIVRKWNRPGGIDRFCAKWLGLAETDPNDTMEHAIVTLFNDVLDISVFAGTPGVLEEQWKPSFDALISRYTDLFLGLDPVTQMLVDVE